MKPSGQIEAGLRGILPKWKCPLLNESAPKAFIREILMDELRVSALFLRKK
jgi:hypothetical protein